MVSFRKSILALAILALFVGLASAQVGTGSGSALGTALTCAANVAVPPQLRAEGVTELIGDIVITCTGGFAPAVGGIVSTANITVSLGTNVTSRILNGGPGSEALLLVDEPGSGLTGSGPALGQSLNGCPSTGYGPGGACGQVYYNPGGVCTVGPPPGTAVACTFPVTAPAGTTPAANVFQGVVANNNQVVFNGIPILAPVTGGFQRIFRITNIRANAAGVGSLGLAGTTPLNASVSISGSTSLPVTNPVFTTGFIQNGLGVSVRSGGAIASGFNPFGLLQCNSLNVGGNGAPVTPNTGASGQATEVLRFAEQFATAFKTRVAPMGLAEPGVGGILPYAQNIPGSIYNSESGFIFPVGGSFAGLADWGTRLRAVFSNIPSGVSVWVSVTNVGGAGSGPTLPVASGQYNYFTAAAPAAVLIQSETAPDFSGQAPVLTPTVTAGGQGVYQVPLTPGANGSSGEAVWEVIAANPNATENFDFAVYYSFTASPGTNSPALGTGKINMSFAPAPGAPGTTPSGSYTTAGGGPGIPRFVDNSTAASALTVSTCSTTLLFPFVTNENGFETGMTIANTTKDTLGTGAQNGACVLNFYAANPSSTIENTTANTANGTTQAPCLAGGICVFNPPPTGATTGNTILAGNTYVNTVSSILGSTNSFTGYVIATCSFQYAHGFAFISDTHATNLAMGYLALVLNGGVQLVGERGVAAESVSH